MLDEENERIQAGKLLGPWFLPRMMDDMWGFGLLTVTGHIIAISNIIQISNCGRWIDVNMLSNSDWYQGVSDNIKKNIIWGLEDRPTASIQISHIVAAFELAYT